MIPHGDSGDESQQVPAQVPAGELEEVDEEVYVIVSENAILEMLRQVDAGMDPDLAYVEFWANNEVEQVIEIIESCECCECDVEDPDDCECECVCEDEEEDGAQ